MKQVARGGSRWVVVLPSKRSYSSGTQLAFVRRNRFHQGSAGPPEKKTTLVSVGMFFSAHQVKLRSTVPPSHRSTTPQNEPLTVVLMRLRPENRGSMPQQSWSLGRAEGHPGARPTGTGTWSGRKERGTGSIGFNQRRGTELLV